MEDGTEAVEIASLVGSPFGVFRCHIEGSADQNTKTPVAIITKILAKIPESPRQLNNEIGAELDELVMRSIAKDPEYRFQNARDFHDTLRTTYNHILVESGIDAVASDEE